MIQKIPWWGAYTDLKHSEIDNRDKGNLKNCFDGLASLAVLFALMHEHGLHGTKVFSNAGFREPREELENSLFK